MIHASATSTGRAWWCWKAILKPNTPSDTVLVFMHPIGGGAYLPMINALARAGHHVIYCKQPLPRDRLALLMEKVVQDLGEAIRTPRTGSATPRWCWWLERRRVAVDVLPTAGREADRDGQPVRRRTRPHRPGADPGRRHLLAAHISRHGTLTEWLDASILDESDPTKRDPELDLYNPDNPEPAAVHRRSS